MARKSIRDLEPDEIWPYTALINELHEARLAQGLSQRDIAERIGTGQSHFSEIEAGRMLVSLLVLLRWCNALGIDIVLKHRT